MPEDTKVRFIVGDKYVDPEGKELGPVKGGEAPAEEDTRTVAQLTEALKGKGVEVPKDAKKPDLVQLAADNGV